MQQPPLLAEEVLSRLTRVARRNGWSIVLVAGFSALLASSHGNAPMAAAAALAAGAGAVEVHGADVLHAREPRGVSLLIRAELLLLNVILIYCAWRLLYPDLTEIRAFFRASLESPRARTRWEELQGLGVTEDQYVDILYHLLYISLPLVSLIYQGGMALYYLKRRHVVVTALADERP